RIVKAFLLLNSESRKRQVPGNATQFMIRQGHHSTCSDQVARPSKLDDATACSRFGILPALAARRPASTAWYIAVAIATGSCARLIAEASSTPSHPSSIARAASDAVPTPASSRIGTEAREQISSILCGFKMPKPV